MTEQETTSSGNEGQQSTEIPPTTQLMISRKRVNRASGLMKDAVCRAQGENCPITFFEAMHDSWPGSTVKGDIICLSCRRHLGIKTISPKLSSQT